MPHRFLLLKMLDQYDALHEGKKLTSGFKKKLIYDLKNAKVEFVHMCTDTSADKVLRDHSSEGFGTYFLVGLNIPEKSNQNMTVILQLIEHLKTSSGSLIDCSKTYQVFTFE